MYKYILIISVLSMAALFEACGGSSGNGGVPTAAVIQDPSETQFSVKGAAVVPYYDAAAELVSQADPTCPDQDKAGHRIIDSRIVPNSSFERKVTVGLPGGQVRQYVVTSTILSNDTVSYSRKDDFQIQGAPTSSQVFCDFKSVTGPALNCLDQQTNKTERLVRDRDHNHCHITSANGDKDNKVTFQTKKVTVSGQPIDALIRVTEHDGLLTCNKKPVGQGKSILWEVFSYSIPSLVKDTCAPAEIYFFNAKMDNANHVYENSSEELTNYSGPVSAPTEAPETGTVVR